MTDITTLQDQYFIQPGDAQALGAPLPVTYIDSLVTPIIDCDDFNRAIADALNDLHVETATGRFIYIANWWLGLSGGDFKKAELLGPDLQVNPNNDVKDIDEQPYRLGGPNVGATFLDDLKKRSQQGVDVRVLGWMSTGIMSLPVARRLNKEGIQSMAGVNALTLQSIVDLRAEPTLEKRAVLNVISHARGGVHTKSLVIGNDSAAIGFTGGLDLQMGRWAKMYHSSVRNWHDVVAKLEGPAALAVYEFFRELWNENIVNSRIRHVRFEGHRIVSHYQNADLVPTPPASLSTKKKGTHRVQSLRTVPQYKYKAIGIVPTPRPCSFAPDGKFEFRYALEKAIKAAKSYIYIEDQSFWSFEVMQWVNVALKSTPQLRVILLTSGAKDPNDPAFADGILCRSLNDGLLSHGTPAEEAQLLSQVRMFRRLNRDQFLGFFPKAQITAMDSKVSRALTSFVAPDNIEQHALAGLRMEIRGHNEKFKVVGNDATLKGQLVSVYIANGAVPPGATPLYELINTPGITVHSKTTLIDDHWAVIGSANIMRRSLYTDFEHSVGVLDEDDELVREYRMKLWDEQFDHGVPADFADIGHSLNAWEPTWGTPGPVTRPVLLEAVPLPLPLPTNPQNLFAGRVAKKYDHWDDPDSRETW